jgi:hypothetical protein
MSLPGATLLLAVLSTAAAAQSREIVRADGVFNSRTGCAAVVLADLDGDGRADLLVGAFLDGDVGSVTVRSGADGHELRRHDGEQAKSGFGAAVERLDDVNGDGVPDYVVSAPTWYDATQQKTTGKLYVFSGADGAPLWSLVGFGDFKQWGTQLARVGDVDGDGATDFVVNKVGGGAVQGGRLELLSGATGASLWIVDAPKRSEYLGMLVRHVRDVDGDGIDEIAATSPGYYSSTAYGKLTLFSGATGAELWTFDGPLHETAGAAIADAGDIDGDGVEDVAISAPDAGPAREGAVHLLSGVDGSSLGDIVGESSSEQIGFRMSDGADFDGDGDPDLAISRIDPQIKVHLALYDARSRTRIADVRTTAGGPADFAVLRAAGDFDGDGFDDLLVGAPNEDSNGAAIVDAMRSPPAVTAVAPDRGDHHADSDVTLTGSGFLLAQQLQVEFGAQAATNLAVVDDATLTCTAPAGPAGLLDVTVHDDAGSATLPAGFAATPALRIEGTPAPGETLHLRFLCDAGDSLFAIAGLPPPVAIPTPPFEGELCIAPFAPWFFVAAWPDDEFDVDAAIPNDPALSGAEFLLQALIGPKLGGGGRSGGWTNCGDVLIQ